MKKIISYALMLFAFAGAMAQNNAGKLDDAGRIAIAPYVPSDLNVTPAVKKQLENKLRAAVSQAGMSGDAIDNRFIITPNIIESGKEVTPTAPPMVALNLDVYVYVGDAVAQKTYGSAVLNLKGVGQNDTKAYMAALRQLRPNHPQLKKLVEDSKTKILEYYNTQCDVILKEANTLSANKQHDAALATLATIPQVCNECYNKALDASKPIFKKFVDRQCTISLADAKAAWNTSQDYAGAQAAAEHLALIDPSAACYQEAQAFSAQIGKEVKRLTDRDWDFMMKQYNDDIALEKQTIQAAKEVGVAYGKGQPDKEIVVKGWMY